MGSLPTETDIPTPPDAQDTGGTPTVRFRLRVMGPRGVQAFPLPPVGTVVIGRVPGLEVRIEDGSISRRHAVLHIGPTLQIEDLGSSNGTRVRGQQVAANTRVDVQGGDLIEFGKVVCMLDDRSSGAASRAATPAPADVVKHSDLANPAIVVVDPAMARLHDMLARVAVGSINVLLLGETGVGKEVFAGQVHARSARAAGPFLKVNCAAFADALIESELFGHERGSFTGAAATKAGLLETAAGGTVFLDEVGELSMPLQAKLLRVIEDREVLRVGGLKPRPIDVRLVAATNRDLEAEVAAGRFRADLFFRLNGIALVIPPLRERPAEIAPLALRFADIAWRQGGRGGAPILSPEALDLLQRHGWPGNIRELRNMMERAVLLAGGATITAEHLPVEKMSGAAPPPPAAPETRVSGTPSLRATRALAERAQIVETLERCGGNQTRAAAELGISRRAFVAKLGSHKLPRPRKHKAE